MARRLSRAARLVAAVLVHGGCNVAAVQLHAAPRSPFDAVIVPGCPSADDGSLSPCQVERAEWAAVLWRRGYARYFITSGAAVYTPYVEAEALAAAMTALGVPADRIYLEPDALHTDENMYNSARIAKALGLRSFAVASNRGHALWGCSMLTDWGQPCIALGVEQDALAAMQQEADALRRVRSRPVEGGLQPLPERERARARATGRRRPTSGLLYPTIAWMRLNGEVWIPAAPQKTPLVTWATRARAVPPS